ncbi:archaeosortase/exosortase family protein [Flammeovirga kamogawensis]|uniref:Archaeosortase/exosortase family protein n=1 Tax=Flammeovirga kamogawensis TaxID=373891 RepID=A0ABX8GVA0_9BACT|nr:archaeosortase/exosortase family protein [Flammeovirga kamogawensis]MBB6459685.1 exosortase/archaeosortase family protein [Flammeovirga kamogawensis]QWG07253.1 archaeosortase/exosortase family protein [Flammeovirga kamogawensis]TRX69073.1 hypothetical protein EO216_13405 [Flammeovirga kamogawensis]
MIVEQQYTHNNQLKTIGIRAVFLFFVWKLLQFTIMKEDGAIDTAITESIVYMSSFFINLFGGEAYHTSSTLYINGIKSVFVGSPCNGLVIMVIFSSFVAITPGRLSTKIVYILVGLVIIYLSNTLRVILLGYNYIQDMETFNFNHKYTYVIIVYSIVFALWMLWIEKFSLMKDIFNTNDQ